MKRNIFVAMLTILLFTACKNGETGKTVAAPENKTTIIFGNADSTAIAETVHGFLAWWAANQNRVGRIDFTKNVHNHLILDEKQLQVYLGEIKKSGFVSDEFIADETKFYRACENIWKTEEVDGVPSGMDADRFFCAQDDIVAYDTKPVVSIIRADRATANLMVSDENPIKFEMKKENGKWLLAKVDCDMGVKY